MWVASGYYDIVLVGGTERVLVMDTPYATRTFAMGSDSYYEGPAGITFPGVFAMLAHLYSHKYTGYCSRSSRSKWQWLPSRTIRTASSIPRLSSSQPLETSWRRG
ncbi:hypothetical protein M1O57_03240 [Dehalococcoidia bacterium]|nr:hypothetical protein [Dehalococcoidia bacterium]